MWSNAKVKDEQGSGKVQATNTGMIRARSQGQAKVRQSVNNNKQRKYKLVRTVKQAVIQIQCNSNKVKCLATPD